MFAPPPITAIYRRGSPRAGRGPCSVYSRRHLTHAPGCPKPCPVDRPHDLRPLAAGNNTFAVVVFVAERINGTAHFDYERAVQNANAVSDEMKNKEFVDTKGDGSSLAE